MDGGASIADSALYFIERQQNRYSHIYSFEPDADTFQQACRLLSGKPRVDVIPKGLWSKNVRLSFDQNSECPRLGTVATDGDFAEVVSLDNFFEGKPESEWPTFIKMDIEGAEKEALLGAERIIRRKKPQLAICAYHKAEDIYELPQTILKIRDDYRFVLRQHAYGAYELVLYAV